MNRIAEQHGKIVRAFRGIPEIRQPHHFLEEDIVARLHHGVNGAQPIHQAENNPSGLGGHSQHHSGQNHRPQKAKYQWPPGSGAAPQEDPAKRFHSEKGQWNQAESNVFFIVRCRFHRRRGGFSVLFFLFPHLGSLLCAILPYCSIKNDSCTLKIFFSPDIFHKKRNSLL